MREGKSAAVFPVKSKMPLMTSEKVDSTTQANTFLVFEELSLPPADLPGRILLSVSLSELSRLLMAPSYKVREGLK